MPNNDKNNANEEAKRKADEEELRCDEEVDGDFDEEEEENPEILRWLQRKQIRAPVNEEAMKKVDEEAKRKAAAEEARRRTAAEVEEAPRKAEVDSVVERLHKNKRELEAMTAKFEEDRERLKRLPPKKRREEVEGVAAKDEEAIKRLKEEVEVLEALVARREAPEAAAAPQVTTEAAMTEAAS